MAKTTLTKLLAAFRTSLARAERDEGYAISDLKIEIPAHISTKGAEILIDVPEPTSTINPAYLSKLSVTLQSMGQGGEAIGEVDEALEAWLPVYSGTTESLYGVFVDKNGEMMVVGTAGTILSSSDGRSFGLETDITQERLHAVWGRNSGERVVAGARGTILRRNYDLGAWTVLDVPQVYHINGIWGSGAGDFFAVGGNSSIFIAIGTASSLALSPAPTILSAIWGSKIDNIFIVGDGGTIYRGGVDVVGKWTHTKLTSGTQRKLYAIWGSGPDDIYVVGGRGKILHSTDGTTWVSQESGTKENLYAVWGSGPKDVYAVGRGGTILHTSDGGAKWVTQKSGTTEALHAIAGRSADEIFIVGTSGVILRRGKGGR